MADHHPSSDVPTTPQISYGRPALYRRSFSLLARHHVITLIPAIACFATATIACVHGLTLVGAFQKDLIDLGRQSYARSYANAIDIWLTLGGFAAAFVLTVLTVRRYSAAHSRRLESLLDQVPLASRAEK